MGFGADIQSKKDRDITSTLKQIQAHDLIKFGIIPELVGRMPVITPISALTRDDLVRILKEPKNSITRQYKALMSYDNIDLEFEDEALEAIADKALEMDIGARGLRSVIEGVMTEIMFEAPSDGKIEKITITADCVNGNAKPKIKHRARPVIDPDNVEHAS
jgi:ATP-dependent Clp protease ATP-binding subunit ClpX